MNKQPINFDETKSNKKSPWGKIAIWLGIIAFVSAMIIGIWGNSHWKEYSMQENMDEFFEPLSWNTNYKEERDMDTLSMEKSNFSQSDYGSVVFEKEFSTERVTSIRVDTEGMNIKINKSKDEQIHCQMVQTANANRARVRYTAEVSGKEFIFKSKKGYNAFSVILSIPEYAYDRLRINTASGDIQVIDAFNFLETSINSASGDIQLQSLKSESLKMNTVSGDIDVLNSNLQEMKVNSVSGNIDIENKATQFDGKVSTVSGDVKWVIPAGTDFGYKITTVSGRIRIGNDQVNGKITYDSASSNYLKMDSVSGGLEIIEGSPIAE